MLFHGEDIQIKYFLLINKEREGFLETDYWKPKRDFFHLDFEGSQANIKIKTLPEVWNSFLFTSKPELRQPESELWLPWKAWLKVVTVQGTHL